jgi:hypothetical protein
MPAFRDIAGHASPAQKPLAPIPGPGYGLPVRVNASWIAIGISGVLPWCRFLLWKDETLFGMEHA